MNTVIHNEIIHIDADTFRHTKVVEKTVTLHVQEPLLLALDANPTTGYTWELVSITDMRVLHLTEHHYHPDHPILAGSGGTDLWEFKGVRVGTSTIHLVYDRVWDKAEPTREVIVKVTVKQ